MPENTKRLSRRDLLRGGATAAGGLAAATLVGCEGESSPSERERLIHTFDSIFVDLFRFKADGKEVRDAYFDKYPGMAFQTENRLYILQKYGTGDEPTVQLDVLDRERQTRYDIQNNSRDILYERKTKPTDVIRQVAEVPIEEGQDNLFVRKGENEGSFPGYYNSNDTTLSTKEIASLTEELKVAFDGWKTENSIK